MKNRGFSIVELVVVIGIIGILLSLATFGFSQYTRKSQIASQTKLLYGDLMEYRVKAMYEKKNWTFKISAAGYGIYSSANTSVAPVSTVTLKHSVGTDVADELSFSTQGLTVFSSSPTDPLFSKSICVSSANDAAVDSVVISAMRVQIGKKKEGVNCVAANIDAK